METHFDFCVVCTSQYESSQKLTSGNGAVKRENLDDEDFQFIAPDRDEHPDSAYKEAHLKPFFVLKNILKVAAEKLEELNDSHDPLSQEDGVQAPLCSPCSALARQFHETFNEVSRLQMILSEIQGKFMDKIQQNKNVQFQGSSSTWKEVRRQVLRTSFGDDHLPNTEESDDFEEVWHFGETEIKSEVADEPDEDDDGSSFRVPAFPESSSVLLKKKTTTAPPAAQVFLECAQCTYKSMHMARFNDHQQVHDPISGATSCEICGTYVLPKRMNLHLRFRHPPQLRKTLRPKRKNRKRKPNPNFNVKVEKSRTWYICRRCPYKTISSGEIATHAVLHSEGSAAIPCEFCNISVLPEQMELHQTTNHSGLQPDESIVKKKAPVIFKCAHCPHQAKGRKHSEDHADLHSEGSGGIPCPKCDVYYKPNPIMSSGHNCGKWKRLKKLRLIKARRSMSRNETSSKLPNPE